MCTKNNNNSGGSFLIGALIGAAIGTALGVLVAPNKGSDTRKKLRQLKDDVTTEGQLDLERFEGVANEILDELKIKAAPVVADIKSFIDNAETASEPYKQELKEKINNLVDIVGESVMTEQKENKVNKAPVRNKKKVFSGLK